MDFNSSSTTQDSGYLALGLKRAEFEQRSELDNTFLIEEANSGQARDKISRKRKAETSPQKIKKHFRSEK